MQCDADARSENDIDTNALCSSDEVPLHLFSNRKKLPVRSEKTLNG